MRRTSISAMAAVALAGCVSLGANPAAEAVLRAEGSPGSAKSSPKRGKYSGEQLRAMAGKRRAPK